MIGKPHISLKTSGHCYVAVTKGSTYSFASIRTAQAHLMPAYVEQTAKQLGIWRGPLAMSNRPKPSDLPYSRA